MERHDGIARGVGQTAGLDPWLREMVAATWRIQRAWEAGGGQWAHKVLVDDRARFATEMRAAETHLRAAIEAEPRFAEPWSWLIELAMTGHAGAAEGPHAGRRHFEAALEREPDHELSWENWLRMQTPPWGGSAEDAERVAVEAAAARWYAGGMPQRVGEALREAGSASGWNGFGSPSRRTLFERFHAGWAEVVAAARVPPRTREERAREAALWYRLGRFDRLAGGWPSLVAGNTFWPEVRSLREVDHFDRRRLQAELALRDSPRGPAWEAAEALAAGGDAAAAHAAGGAVAEADAATRGFTAHRLLGWAIRAAAASPAAAGAGAGAGRGVAVDLLAFSGAALELDGLEVLPPGDGGVLRFGVTTQADPSAPPMLRIPADLHAGSGLSRSWSYAFLTEAELSVERSSGRAGRVEASGTGAEPGSSGDPGVAVVLGALPELVPARSLGVGRSGHALVLTDLIARPDAGGRSREAELPPAGPTTTLRVSLRDGLAQAEVDGVSHGFEFRPRKLGVFPPSIGLTLLDARPGDVFTVNRWTLRPDAPLPPPPDPRLPLAHRRG